MVRRIALLTLTGILLALTCSWLLYRGRSEKEWMSAGVHVSTVLSELTRALARGFEQAEQDLRLLSRLESLRAARPGEMEAARNDFESFARTRPDYSQIRFLDVQGRELIRFDRTAEGVVGAPVLQDKSDRYYFREMSRLESDRTYVSALDWNIEFGRVQEPRHPTLRFGIRGAGGFVILNADARAILRGLREAALALQGEIRVIDDGTRATLVRAGGGLWEFLPGPAPELEGIVREAAIDLPARRWLLRAHLSRDAVIAQARRGFLDHLLVTAALVALLLASGGFAIRAGRRATELQLARRHAAEVDSINRELVLTRELLVERTRLATLGEMAPALAHELRNPLQAMLTATRSLREDVRSEDGGRLLDILAEEITRLQEIATELLTDARRPTEEHVDLAPLAGRVVELLRAGRHERPIPEILLEPPALPVRVRGVPGEIKQVLWNLLLNACEAAGPEGRVWVRVARAGPGACIEVEDHGPGLCSSKESGHGIGLSLCDALLRRHDGTLELGASSRGGARVRAILPAAEPAEVRP
jgi:signal transduction histidine kinase